MKEPQKTNAPLPYNTPEPYSSRTTEYTDATPIQRVVVSDSGQDSILDKFNRKEECVQAISEYIFKSRFRANMHALMPNFDDLFDAVNTVYDSVIKDAVLSESPNKISVVANEVIKIAHTGWLNNAPQQGNWENLPRHEMMQQNPAPFLKHYNLFDKNMIWRWTSKPSTEQVYTAKKGKDGDEISYDYIVKVVADHSGGNDKSNPYVKTLSFGRNPAALMGVAASIGGDKHVLNIIDKAEYLYGIDIGSLASKGISAHAASARMISLFESEYVLVSTPGFPSFSLDELATIKYKNPFKGQAINMMLTQDEKESQMFGIEEQMGSITPESINETSDIDKFFSKKILINALKTKHAAQSLSSAVMDKEPLDPGTASTALTKFQKGLI